MLDILLIREDGHSSKPWLTVILDDYSRAVAGYFLSFEAPGVRQTVACAGAGIWRKDHARWSRAGFMQVVAGSEAMV